MRWKTTLVLLIAVIGLGSYIALYEIKQPTLEERAERTRQIVRLSSDEVTSLVVEFPQAKGTVERKNGSWRLTNPLAVRAEESLVRRILNALDSLEAERVLEGSKEAPLVLSDFGLEPPRGTLMVIAGPRALRLDFGEATAVGDNRYVRLPDSPKVFVVSSELFDALTQPLESYRSHELLNFETWKASEIHLMSPQSAYRLSKQSNPASGGAGQWRLAKPLVDEADTGAIATTLSKLRALRIERFIIDEPQVEQLPEWGFEAPYAQIAIALGMVDSSPTSRGEGTKPLELFIGKPTADNPDQRYVKRTDEPTIYAVASQRIDELLQDPQALRSHTCLDISASQVTKLQVAWQDTTWIIEKVEGQWKIAEGQVNLDSSKVEDFLWKLRDVKLTRFVEDTPEDVSRYGLNPPRGEIQVWAINQQEPRQLLIGDAIDQDNTPARPSDNGTGGRYGRIGGRMSVVELPSTINEILNTKPDSLTVQPPEAPVTRNQ